MRSAYGKSKPSQQSEAYPHNPQYTTSTQQETPKQGGGFRDRWNQVTNKFQRETKYGKKRNLYKWLFNFLLACLFVAGGMFAFLNVQPYIEAVELMLAQITNWQLVNFVLGIPIIGWLLSFVTGTFTSLMGVVLWFIIQVFELMPRLLTRSAKMLRTIISQLEQFEMLKVRDNDHPFVAQLKEMHNEIPVQWIERASRYSAIAYMVDLGLGLYTYPPISGGFEAIRLYFIAPTIEDVNWSAFLIIAIMMFAVEWIWDITEWVVNIIQHWRLASQRSE